MSTATTSYTAVEIPALPPTGTHSANRLAEPFEPVFPRLHTLYDYDERIKR